MRRCTRIDVADLSRCYWSDLILKIKKQYKKFIIIFLLVKQVKQVKKKKTCTYSLSAILGYDSVVAGIPEIEVCSATYVFLRMGVGIIKEIRRAAVAARKASSWHKFGTGSYLLL